VDGEVETGADGEGGGHGVVGIRKKYDVGDRDETVGDCPFCLDFATFCVDVRFWEKRF